MKKIATMFLGLSLVVGSVPVFAADDAAKDTKATKTKTKKTGAAKVEGKKKGKTKKTTTDTK